MNVEDVNDNTPICEKTNYVFYAEETPYNNTEIGQVKAVDADKVSHVVTLKMFHFLITIIWNNAKHINANALNIIVMRNCDALSRHATFFLNYVFRGNLVV